MQESCNEQPCPVDCQWSSRVLSELWLPFRKKRPFELRLEQIHFVLQDLWHWDHVTEPGEVAFGGPSRRYPPLRFSDLSVSPVSHYGACLSNLTYVFPSLAPDMCRLLPCFLVRLPRNPAHVSPDFRWIHKLTSKILKPAFPGEPFLFSTLWRV